MGSASEIKRTQRFLYAEGDKLECPSIKFAMALKHVMLLGLTCFFAALFSLLSFGSEYELIGINSAMVSGNTVMMFPCVVVVGCFWLTFRLSDRHNVICLTAAVVFLCGLLAFVVASLASPENSLFWHFAMGIALGALMILWFYGMGVSKALVVGNEAYRLASLSLIGAAAFCLLIACMNAMAVVVAQVILCLASFLVVALALYDEANGLFAGVKGWLRRTVTRERHALPYRALVYAFAYSFFMAWGYSFVSSVELAHYMPQLIALVLALAGITLYVVWLKCLIVRMIHVSIRCFLPIAAAVIASFAYYPTSVVCLVVSLLAIWSGTLTTVARLSYGVKIGGALVGQFDGTVITIGSVDALGLSAGFFVRDLFFTNDELGGIAVGASIAIIASIAVVMFGVGKGGYNLQSDALVVVEQDRVIKETSKRKFEDACDSISMKYHLTNRQAEVLRYLGKGRNARYLCEKLSISEHTANSHIYGIYKKVGVHSQQDLMELIDDYMNLE